MQHNPCTNLLAASTADLHLVDAPWLQEELLTIGICAKQVHYPAPILKATALPPLPLDFSVLTYIPDRRYRFYGGPAIAEAAQRFPNVSFNVVGGTGAWLRTSLSNLHFHGWQKDLDPFYRNASVLVRLVEHDALGSTVQEALCYARHVIYSYPLPHCLRAGVRDADLLICHLGGLLSQHETGLLLPNSSGWRYGIAEFNEGRFCGQFLKILMQFRASVHQNRAEGGRMSTGALASPVSEPVVADTGKRLHYLTLQATAEGQAAYAHVYEIVRGLGRRGWRTEVFEPSFSGGRKLLRGSKPGVAGKLLEFLRLQSRLLRHANRPDILYVRAHPLALPALWWARLRGIRSVAEVNSTYEDVFSMYSWTTKLRWLVEVIGDSSLRAADRLITVTPELKQWLEERFPGKPVSVVPNGANIELFRPDAPASLLHLKPYVLFVGTLSPWQGIEVLLAATHQTDWPAAVRLVIAGDGPERARVEAEALRNERICFLGTQPYGAIPGFLTGALAAFSVGTSLRRYFSPLKLYEALACGTPVIVSDQPVQTRLVRELACGLVLPSEDAAAVARAVAWLAGDEEKCREMGHRGYLAVHGEHSWQHRADQTGRILLDDLGGTSGPLSVAGGARG